MCDMNGVPADINDAEQSSTRFVRQMSRAVIP